MTLREALQALAADGADPDAWLAVMEHVQALSRGPSVVPKHREQCVLDVIEKLLSCVRQPGWIDGVDHPRAYVRTMLANRSRSLHRREQRRAAIEAAGPKPVAPSDPPPPLPHQGRLEELFRKALSRRQPRYRPFLQQAWDDLQQVLAGATLGDAIEARGEAVSTKTINAAYKSQERLRQALLDVIAYRRETGGWTREDAEVYEAEVRLLLRCQGRARSGVSGGGS